MLQKWGVTSEVFLTTCYATFVATQVARKIAQCNTALKGARVHTCYEDKIPHVFFFFLGGGGRKQYLKKYISYIILAMCLYVSILENRDSMQSRFIELSISERSFPLDLLNFYSRFGETILVFPWRFEISGYRFHLTFTMALVYYPDCGFGYVFIFMSYTPGV